MTDGFFISEIAYKMLTMPIEQNVDLIICGISFILYVMVIYTIIKDRRDPRLSSSFFLLSAALAGPDIVYYLFVHVNRARKYAFFPGLFESLPSPVPKLMLLFKFHLKFAQLFAIVIFAINRYSAFKPGSRFAEWWSLKGLVILQLLQWLMPIWVYIPGFTHNYNVTFEILPGSPALRQVADPDLYMVYFSIEALGNLIASIASTVFYGIAIRAVINITNGHGLGLTKKFKAEYRIFVTALFMFVLIVLDTVYCLATVFYQTIGDYVTVKTLDNWWYPLTDCLCMVQPWTLIAASAELRRRVLRRFLCGARWLPQSLRASNMLKTKMTVVPLTAFGSDIRLFS